MKKYWIGAAALLLAAGLTLSGCGNDSGRETGKIHAVTHANWKPFEYMKDGKITGFDAVFLEEAAKRAGLSAELGDAGWEALLSRSVPIRQILPFPESRLQRKGGIVSFLEALLHFPSGHPNKAGQGYPKC